MTKEACPSIGVSRIRERLARQAEHSPLKAEILLYIPDVEALFAAMDRSEAVRMAYLTGYREATEDAGWIYDYQAAAEGWEQYSEGPEIAETLEPTPSSDMEGWWMIERDDQTIRPYVRPMYFCWRSEPGSKHFPHGKHDWTPDWKMGARFSTKEAAEEHTNGDPLLHVRSHAMMQSAPDMERMREALRPFPMLGGNPPIPWALAEIVHKAYTALGHAQSLERIAERGGFGWKEVGHLFDELRRKNSRLAKQLTADAIAALHPSGGL